MPKLASPFVRKLNEKGDYIVTSEISDGCEWVFTDPDVLATEKLDGTNVSIVIENGIITSIWNRTNRIPFFCKGKKFIMEAVLNSFERGYCELPDGQWFGEALGPKLNGNPLKLTEHIWIPFTTYCQEKLAYKSFHKYPKTFENISKWFNSPISEGGIFSLFMRRRGIEQAPEGVVFVQPSTGNMCKLRCDMFAEFKGDRHRSNAEAKAKGDDADGI